MNKTWFFLLCIGLLGLATPAHAQYFGRNKPRYGNINFQVNETQHFQIYDYLNNPEKLREMAASAEVWYRMHQAVLRDTFYHKNPLLIYNNHGDFQQTNTIQGSISVGTGGVTEGLRNRLVFPMAMTNQQTNHVLGHELVHAFQYHMVLGGDSTNMQNFANLPLWMVEGLAEYMSIGRIDPHTALWMRDAVMTNQVPRSFRDLETGRYFPYRWGQAFWAYIAGVYGDDVIRDLFMNTAKYGLEAAVPLTLSTTTQLLAQDWINTLRNHYGRWVPLPKLDEKGKVDEKDLAKIKDKLPGKTILSDKNAGNMNISPVLSPNGKYVIFLSEKNLFTTDLFLADAKTGKIIKKVASTSQDGHIDQFNFIESAGTWAPDDKRFAFDVYQTGKSTLVIRDVFRGKTLDKIQLPDVPAFSNPTWSPDGKTIVVSGLANGQVDLYAYDLRTKKTRRLTNDRYSEALPQWSADGKSLVFSTDQLSFERGGNNGVMTMSLAVLDVASGKVEHVDVFPGADNLNPHYDRSGNILFLSNRDGFRNLYRYDLSSKKVYQMTNLLTGITGITPYAPAITVAEDRDRILYTHYARGEYTIYQAQSSDFKLEEVSPTAVDLTAAALPPFNPRTRDIVNKNLRLMQPAIQEDARTVALTPQKYKPKFQLEYIGGGVGVNTGTNTTFGNAAGAAGGVSALFGDMLGRNQIFAGASVNGDIQDAMGQATYLNRKGRLGWGFTGSHFPLSQLTGYQQPTLQRIQVAPGVYRDLYEEIVQVDRLFNQRVGGLVFYPFSTTKRVEMSANMDLYSQRATQYFTYYDLAGNVVTQNQERGPAGPRFNMGNITAAYVGDNSHFGFTAPLNGWRYRVSAEQFLGYWNFSAALADGRYYKRVKPFTFAVRGLAYGRFGGNSNNPNEVFPLIVTQPWFVRGYSLNYLRNEAPGLQSRAVGSKIGVGNAEVRLPFTGPKGFALLPFNFLMTDLNFFADAGLAWFENSQLRGDNGTAIQRPLVSVGISLRANLFGAIILEPFYALPISAPAESRRWLFGLNIVPGW